MPERHTMCIDMHKYMYGKCVFVGILFYLKRIPMAGCHIKDEMFHQSRALGAYWLQTLH